jgi:hypothetical protein
MNYRELLSRPQSRANTTAIYKHVGNYPHRLKQLAELVFGKDRLLQQRAVWPFSEVLIEYYELAKPYYAKIISAMEDEQAHEAVARNLLRIFQGQNIPEKYSVRVLDLCLHWIRSEQVAIAIRAFSITVATQICTKYPELIAELKLILNELSQHPMSAAIQVRVKRSLKELQKAGF